MSIAQFAFLIFKDQFLLQVLTPDCRNNIGSIVHAWDSMSAGYKLTVTFPTIEVTTEMKAVILGAAFLLVGNTKINSIRQSVKKSSLNCKQHNELPKNIPYFLVFNTMPCLLIIYQYSKSLQTQIQAKVCTGQMYSKNVDEMFNQFGIVDKTKFLTEVKNVVKDHLKLQAIPQISILTYSMEQSPS